MNSPKRSRPAQHSGERKLKMNILDEMESEAQNRIGKSAGGRIALSAKLKLEWSDCEEGFYYQWATDSESYPINLQQYCDAGYTFVRHKAGSSKGEPVIQN